MTHREDRKGSEEDGPSALTPSSVRALREETPGTAERIHLNNAGAGLMPEPVLSAVVSQLDLESRIGGYEAAEEASGRVAAAYEAVASLVGSSPSNVAFVESATAGIARALSAIPFKAGDRIVTTRNDYVSNQIMYLSLKERLGVDVVRAPEAPEGGVDPRRMEELVHRLRPRLVAVTHVPTNSGLVQPVEEVGRICRRRGVSYLVDACQSVGQLPVRVEEVGCDFLAASARKFLRGPRGSGFLYVSDRILDQGLEPLFPDLRGADWVDDDLYQPAPDARRFEWWESSVAGVLGTGAAARYALQVGVAEGGIRACALAERLRGSLSELPGCRVLDRGENLSAIVTATFADWSPRDLVVALREEGVNSSASESGSGLLDFRDKGVEGALRLSPHYYNTEEEVDRTVEILERKAGGRDG